MSYHTLCQGSMEEPVFERGYWELEDEMKKKYPYLFEDSGMSSLEDKLLLGGGGGLKKVGYLSKPFLWGQFYN